MLIGGGGVFIPDGSHPVLVGCKITGNFAIVGGGINVQGLNDPVIQSCVIIRNKAGTGGGMAAQGNTGAPGSVPTQILDTRFEENVATNLGGGGLVVSGGALGVLTGCTFINNTADDTESTGLGGGGLMVYEKGTARLRDCLLTGNKATATGNPNWETHGGAIATGGTSDQPSVFAVKCTFDSNRAIGVGLGGAGFGAYTSAPVANARSIRVLHRKSSQVP